jgi:hypothetical protein
MTFKQFCSKGGKASKGTEAAKIRAVKAAKARWAKHRALQPTNENRSTK